MSSASSSTKPHPYPLGDPLFDERVAPKAAVVERGAGTFGAYIDTALPEARFAGAKPLIIVLSGALSPIHRSHVALLRMVKGLIEAGGEGRPPRQVLSCLLIPSSHSYVKGKLGDGAVPLHGRVELCKRAVADDGAPWLGVMPWGIASGAHCCEVARHELQQQHENLDRSDGELSVIDRFGAVDVVALYGSDFLVRAPGCLRKPTLIYTRQDEEDTATKAMHVVAEGTKNGVVHPEFIFLSGTPDDPGAKSAVTPLSSTLVRNLLVASREGDADARAQLQQHLHPSVFAACTAPDSATVPSAGEKHKQRAVAEPAAAAASFTSLYRIGRPLFSRVPASSVSSWLGGGP